MSKYKFENIIFDDIEFKTDNECNDWSGICKNCVNKYNINKNLLDDFGSGCCMVESCQNEADFYIDFPEGSIIKISP